MSKLDNFSVSFLKSSGDLKDKSIRRWHLASDIYASGVFASGYFENVKIDGPTTPGYVLTADADGWGTWQVASSASGVTTFTGLTDAPNSYAGMSASGVRVNATSDGLEFYDPGYTNIDTLDIVLGRGNTTTKPLTTTDTITAEVFSSTNMGAAFGEDGDTNGLWALYDYDQGGLGFPYIFAAGHSTIIGTVAPVATILMAIDTGDVISIGTSWFASGVAESFVATGNPYNFMTASWVDGVGAGAATDYWGNIILGTGFGAPGSYWYVGQVGSPKIFIKTGTDAIGPDGTTLLSVGTSSNGVYTKNNILDDGCGNSHINASGIFQNISTLSITASGNITIGNTTLTEQNLIDLLLLL